MGSNIALFDEVRIAEIIEITGSYTPFGSPFGHPMRILHFINDTDGAYMLSTDGVTDMVPLIGDSFNLYDLTSDEDENEMMRMAQGTQWYIKFLVEATEIADTTNSVYLACMYGKGEGEP